VANVPFEVINTVKPESNKRNQRKEVVHRNDPDFEWFEKEQKQCAIRHSPKRNKTNANDKLQTQCAF
jgi:hypothetical protein